MHPQSAGTVRVMLLAFFMFALLLAGPVMVVKAQLSDECLDEIEAIRSSVSFRVEDARLEALVESIPFENFCTGSETELNCVTDYAIFENQLETICNDLGGVYLESDYFLNCVTTDEISYTFENKDIPTCIGKSCDLAELNEEADGQFLEYELALEGQGLECEVDNVIRNSRGQVVSRASSKPLGLVAQTLTMLGGVALWMMQQ